ncbi:RNA 2',3'-cyclic phosphodiesterase [Anaerosporobacter sp.]|uniref:RNA 2',3'-cyclic phosphodiesterase n=1 Tax=Anaerosporobacter sp. TaxID=1872529 RepID=UPI0028A03E78|nr:RNA 2',3'-cyclic phosphodiesterase [Anaerosporobacter sp.]
MRLFIAINFTPEVKEQLCQTIQDLSKEAVSGNFTRISNLHLTVAFLGEVSSDRLQDIRKIMNQTAFGIDVFEMEIGGLGKFINEGEFLYWCGIRENETLDKLQQSLIQGLKANEFSVDDKPFKPHITLGRRCRMNSNFEEKEFAKKISSISMKVITIDLMKSENKEGKLTYTSVGEVKLNG